MRDTLRKRAAQQRAVYRVEIVNSVVAAALFAWTFTAHPYAISFTTEYGVGLFALLVVGNALLAERHWRTAGAAAAAREFARAREMRPFVGPALAVWATYALAALPASHVGAAETVVGAAAYVPAAVVFTTSLFHLHVGYPADELRLRDAADPS